MSGVSSPQKVPKHASFWTQNKPCEEALPLLVEAYNKLADEVERLWSLEEQLEAAEQHVSSRPELLLVRWTMGAHRMRPNGRTACGRRVPSGYEVVSPMRARNICSVCRRAA